MDCLTPYMVWIPESLVDFFAFVWFFFTSFEKLRCSFVCCEKCAVEKIFLPGFRYCCAYSALKAFAARTRQPLHPEIDRRILRHLLLKQSNLQQFLWPSGAWYFSIWTRVRYDPIMLFHDCL